MNCALFTFGLVLISMSHLIGAQPDKSNVTDPLQVCSPKIEMTSLSGRYDSAVEQRIEELYQADQADRQIMTQRQPTSEEAARIFANDLSRRQEVYAFIARGQVASGSALHQAALIFQHGDCSDHYKLASRLAAEAIKLGYTKNKWLYAAALDRYLISIGKREKFGTQTTGGCPGDLEFYDPKTTDIERAVYDVPTLAKLKARKPYFCN